MFTSGLHTIPTKDAYSQGNIFLNQFFQLFNCEKLNTQIFFITQHDAIRSLSLKATRSSHWKECSFLHI